ncbi:hypothetical protein EVG20_g10089 [Dentipellis fragilis]|uniref:Integrase catalytic domain-containing protein n=1 Tax=Dentipellis fragilis TaxID=205917 RepID=A0A4Y9XT88_9AGAM|nr:hypothetical protein EVG20_g10089 [Dentipellis fragilis]
MPQAGHPGRHKTYELVTRNYWWPGMSVFIRDYVDGCATCQATKNWTHRPHVETVPNAISARPFQDIISDFIVDLPACEGFDSVCVIVDRFTKHVTITPCTKTITSDEMVDILIDKIYRHYGLWDRLISDRGPQYAGKIMRGVFDKLQITSALSTAYHPQTDGESEHFNQEFEKYLRAFCNYRQDDWVKWIPFAEFSHNHRSHSATGRSPFEMLLGYIPVAIPSVKTSSPVPTVEEHFRHMDQIREDLQASLQVAAEIMKRTRGDSTQPGVHYQKGDKVWLDGKNVRTTCPKAKLAAKYLGPFEITNVIGPVTYRLKLPSTWCIHPVFHASLLSPYKETDAHGSNFLTPAPDLVEGKEEYEVEKVLNARLTRNKCGIEYLVKWTGYPDSENQWRSRTMLSNATRAITDFYK